MISMLAMHRQAWKTPEDAAAVAKARGISSINPSYTQKVFSVLQKHFGGELSHHGFPGENGSLQGARTANRFSGDVPNGSIRLVLEGACDTPQLVLRVTAKRYGHPLDVRIPMQAPEPSVENIAKEERRDFHDLQVLLGAAATAIEVIREWGEVLPASGRQIRVLAREVAAMPDTESGGISVEQTDALDLTAASRPADFPQRCGQPVHTPLEIPAACAANKRRPDAAIDLGETSTAPKVRRLTNAPNAFLFGDEEKLAQELMDGAAVFISPAGKYQVVISGLNHMNRPAPGPDADNCIHIEFKQFRARDPIEVKATVIDKALSGGRASCVYVVPPPNGATRRTALNAKLLPFAACIARRVIAGKTMGQAFLKGLLGSDSVLDARRRIFGIERIFGVDNRELVTAMLAFKPILKSTGAAQINEMKHASGLFDLMLKIVEDNLNERDHARQYLGELPYQVVVVGLHGRNMAPPPRKDRRTLLYDFGRDPANGNVTLRIEGAPRIPPGQVHVYLPTATMKDDTIQSSILAWAAALTNCGLTGATLPAGAKLRYAVEHARESIYQSALWQAEDADETQVMARFQPLVRAARNAGRPGVIVSTAILPRARDCGKNSPVMQSISLVREAAHPIAPTSSLRFRPGAVGGADGAGIGGFP